MEDYEERASTWPGQPPAPRRSGRRWLLIVGLAFAFMLALGIGTLLGSTVSTTRAASVTTGSANSAQALAFPQGDFNSVQAPASTQGNFNSDQSLAATPGARGKCDALTVSSVSGNTIVAQTSSGSKVTIHTTASTQYNQAGKSVTASAITTGTRIHVSGTHNSDGSITATRIDIG